MRRSILAILALAAFAVNPAHAATESYVAGSAGDVEFICKNEATNPTGQNIGGACFTKSTSATIKIRDLHGEFVPFWIQALNSAGNCVGDPNPGDPTSDCPGFFFAGCANATVGKTVSLPGGTVKIEVILDGPVFFAIEPCEGLLATNGTITVT